jgi:hypothetical protein
MLARDGCFGLIDLGIRPAVLFASYSRLQHEQRGSQKTHDGLLILTYVEEMFVPVQVRLERLLGT